MNTVLAIEPVAGSFFDDPKGYNNGSSWIPTREYIAGQAREYVSENEFREILAEEMERRKNEKQAI